MAVFAFDPDVTLLQGAVGYVAPTRVEPIAGEPLPVELIIRSLGGQFDLKITETVDPQLQIIAASSQGTVEHQTITWKQGLGNNDTAVLSYVVALPEEGGTFSLSSEVSYLKGGTHEIYKTCPLTVRAEKGLVALKADILVSLQCLAAQGGDTTKLGSIIGTYRGVIEKPAFTEQQIDEVIRALLQLADDLPGVGGDSAAVRQELDWLIRIYERKWSLK